MICGYVSNACWMIVGEKITKRLRSDMFDALLKKEVGVCVRACVFVMFVGNESKLISVCA